MGGDVILLENIEMSYPQQNQGGKNMREVIAKRDQRTINLILVVCTIGLINGFFWNIEDLEWMKIVLIIANIIGIVFGLYMKFYLPSNSIVRENDTLILSPMAPNMDKVAIKIADIKDVVLMPHPEKDGEFFKGAITIIAIIDGEEQKHDCFELINAPKVIEKLKALIGK